MPLPAFVSTENQAVEGLQTRAKAICELERSIALRPNFNDKKLFPRYLHILESTGQAAEQQAAGEWSGRLKAMRQMLERNHRSSQVQVRCFVLQAVTSPVFG